MRKTQFYNNGYFHVYNRGVDKRDVFLDKGDKSFLLEKISRSYRPLTELIEGKLIEVICYCLMDNHFHFLLRQVAENGISKFMHKLCTSYAMRFNNRNDRSGHLFEGPFKAKEITTDAQLLHVSRYIHLNPLDIFQPQWKSMGYIDPDLTLQQLTSYRWSSLKNFLHLSEPVPDFLHPDPILDAFSDVNDYADFVLAWASMLQAKPGQARPR